jgi:ABC-type transporter Mla maintaining outer membrane lipid asymmetry ATPase subunit MlaF
MIRPELLILEEPTAGLDPFIQLEFEHLCEEARS